MRCYKVCLLNCSLYYYTAELFNGFFYYLLTYLPDQKTIDLIHEEGGELVIMSNGEIYLIL